MDLSIVIPILDDHQRFLQNYAEYSAFFQKFGIQFELIVVCSNLASHDTISQEISNSTPESPSKIKLILNSLNKSRSGAVAQGILNSTGKVIVVSTADQMTPLASYFAALQAFMSDSSLLVLSGNRFDPKRQLQGNRTATKLERVESHNRFFKDIFQLSVVDPTTPFLALRNDAIIQTYASELKNINCWYYTPFWLNKISKKPQQYLEISIQENSTAPSRYRPLVDSIKVYWSAILNR